MYIWLYIVLLKFIKIHTLSVIAFVIRGIRSSTYLSYKEINVTFQVNTYIEDCIAQKDPLIKILRLVCMQSVCNNGLKQKVLDYYKREILQVQ